MLVNKTRYISQQISMAQNVNRVVCSKYPLLPQQFHLSQIVSQ